MSVVNEERNYTVYIHVNKINEKTYVGITQRNPEDRWRNNGSGYQTQVFWRAIKKYGWDNFEHIILFENKTREEAEELEILVIKILMSNKSTYGYNVENGGNGKGRMSESTKAKLRKIHIGRKITEETRIKLSKSHMGLLVGSKNPNSEKVICDNRIFNSVVECAGYYNINPNIMRKWLLGYNGMPKKFINLNLYYINRKDLIKPQIKQGTNNPMCKKVVCEGIIYNSISSCARYYNVPKSTISSWLKDREKMPLEFIDKNLKFVNDDEVELKYDIHKKMQKKIICNDIIYNSLNECANEYNINYVTMGQWLRGDRGIPEYFVNLGLRYLDYDYNQKPRIIQKGENAPNSKKIICDNKIFTTIKDCSNFYNIKYYILQNWLRGITKMPQKYIDLGLRYYNPEVDSDIEQYEQYIETKAM